MRESRAVGRVRGVVSGGAGLIGDLLVAVCVVDRGDEDDQVLAQLAVGRDEVAQQHQRGLFALHLTGVNVGHDEDDGLAGGGVTGLGRRKREAVVAPEIAVALPGLRVDERTVGLVELMDRQ